MINFDFFISLSLKFVFKHFKNHLTIHQLKRKMDKVRLNIQHIAVTLQLKLQNCRQLVEQFLL